MRTSSLLRGFVVVAAGLVACAPDGEQLADTDDTSGTGSSGTDGSTTVASTTVTTSASTTMTTGPSTTADPDTSTTDDPSGTDSDATTGECPPGDEGCPCDVGSSCQGDLICEKGICIGEPSCDEPEGEPNDDEASAVESGDVVMCGAPAMMASGGLDGAESDWFTFQADGGNFCFSDPRAAVTADADLAVCMFAECDTGDTNVNCSGGAADLDSPDGAAGCCDQNTVTLDFGCGFMGAGNGTIWVRVTSVEAACIPYELAWEY